MEKDTSIVSFRAGLFIFILLTLSVLGGGGSFVLLVAYLVPGPLYGFALAGSYEGPTTYLEDVLFIILSTAINLLCAYKVNFLDGDSYAPLRLIACGAAGAVLLALCHDLLLYHRFSLLYTIIYPLLLGIAASLFSAGCMHLSLSNKYKDPVATILMLGIFTIFPIWQYLFGLNIKNYNKARAVDDTKHP